jgi:hypothetical protein
MPVIGKPPTWHFCQLCGHWANMALKGKKRKVQVYQIIADDAEAEMVLAAAEYNTLIEKRAANLRPIGKGK